MITEKKLMQNRRGFLVVVVIVNLFQVGKSKALNLAVVVEIWKEMYNFLENALSLKIKPLVGKRGYECEEEQAGL